VSDPLSAAECAAENAILTHIQPGAIEQTGGLFVQTEQDDPAYAEQFLAAAAQAGVWAEEIDRDTALRLEPRLNPRIIRAFTVADGSVDGWQIAWTAGRSAQDYGAQILTYHQVTGLVCEQGRVCRVLARDRRGQQDVQIDCQFVLNCAGAWAGQVAALAGLRDVAVVPGRGIMIAMNQRLVNRVINRCTYPADGDILVPNHSVCIIGTTDVKVGEPDGLLIDRAEVQQMLDAGEALIPGFREARALRAWAGARPLIKDNRVADDDTRHMSRGMQIVDHARHDGLAGLLTIGGGKLTTYRLMAEHIVDAMEDQLGQHHPCRTADEPCPSAGLQTMQLPKRLHQRLADRHCDPVICECEQVSRSMLVSLLQSYAGASLDDIRRQLRIGMGPCQGGFCSTRAVGVALDCGAASAEQATSLLRAFLEHRWIGLWPILHGDQLRQTALDDWILQGLLNIEHLPPSTQEVL
jgi:glycerol-3-phosphate dehydrogenase